MEILYENVLLLFQNGGWQRVVMWLIGALLIYLAIKIIFGKDANRHAVTAKICLAAALLLMALEDIDGANWCVCIFYILLGFLQTKALPSCRSGETEGSKDE